MTSLNNEHSYSARSIRNGLIAGYTAGITGIIVGHPLDSIKVLLQTQTNGSGASSTRSSASSSMGSSTSVASSSVQARNMSTIAAVGPAVPSQTTANSITSQGSLLGKRSIRALYSGVTGPLLTTGILQSLNFAIYDSVRRVLYQHQLQSSDMCNSVQPDDYLHYDNLSSVAMASFAAGATTSVLTSPMIIVKTKQQLMTWGFRKAIRDTYHSGFNRQPHVINGLSNFYAGFGIHFFCDAIGRSLYMYSYELLKRQLAKLKCNNEQQSLSQFSFESMNNNRVSTANLSIPDRMVCAALSGMICWAFIYPADVMRSKVYAKSLKAQTSLTTLDGIILARTMVREQGFKSLYRGMGVTVLRAGPVAASVLPIYDCVLEWLSSS